MYICNEVKRKSTGDGRFLELPLLLSGVDFIHFIHIPPTSGLTIARVARTRSLIDPGTERRGKWTLFTSRGGKTYSQMVLFAFFSGQNSISAGQRRRPCTRRVENYVSVIEEHLSRDDFGKNSGTEMRSFRYFRGQ